MKNHNGKQFKQPLKWVTEDALIMRSGAVNMRLPFNLEGERRRIRQRTRNICVTSENRINLNLLKRNSNGWSIQRSV